MGFTVALVQTALAWQDPEANRQHVEPLIRPQSGKADLIVLPEMFSSGFTMEPATLPRQQGLQTLDWMREMAFATDAALAGSIVWPEGDAYYNRFVFMEPSGEYHTYDKRHTFTLSGEDQVYRSGTRKVDVTFRGLTFSLQICYDLRFPVWSRNTSDYDALLYVANWPAPRVGAWDALLKARAIENMAYVVGVNRTGSDANGLEYLGHSAVYDGLGEQVAYAGEKDAVITAKLSREHLLEARKKLRFLEDRDVFTPGW